jgi:hypothetical protein
MATANLTVEALRAQLSQRVTKIALALSATPALPSVETPGVASTPSRTATAPLIGSQPPAVLGARPDRISEHAFVLLEQPAPAQAGEAWQVAWQTSFVLAEGEAFELVFWNEGQDPLRDGIGLASPTTDNRVVIDLAALDNRQARLLEPGDYRYGVLLVRLSPYERVGYFGSSLVFRYVRSDND